MTLCQLIADWDPKQKGVSGQSRGNVSGLQHTVAEGSDYREPDWAAGHSQTLRAKVTFLFARDAHPWWCHLLFGPGYKGLEGNFCCKQNNVNSWDVPVCQRSLLLQVSDWTFLVEGETEELQATLWGYRLEKSQHFQSRGLRLPSHPCSPLTGLVSTDRASKIG